MDRAFSNLFTLSSAAPGAARWSVLLTLAATVITAGMAIGPEKASAEDIVTIRTGRNGESTRRLFGTITEWRGNRMTIQRAGREESVDTAKVIRFQTKYLPQHLEGRRLFQQRNYAAALNQLRAAVDSDNRNWVRRDILADVVTCRRNLGQLDAACATFLAIYETDSQTRHLNVMPLAWRSERASGGMQAQAVEWMRQENPAARLMGASWLLSGGRRELSMETLSELTNNEDKRIAQLAQAQLWRTRLVTANKNDVKVWEAAVERLPEDLRAGPYYMVAQLQARLKEPEAAAIAYLRCPVLFPHQRTLCEQSLFAAAGQLESLGQLDAARNVYRELLRGYVGSVYEDEAKLRYEELEKKRKKRSGT